MIKKLFSAALLWLCFAQPAAAVTAHRCVVVFDAQNVTGAGTLNSGAVRTDPKTSQKKFVLEVVYNAGTGSTLDINVQETYGVFDGDAEPTPHTTWFDFGTPSFTQVTTANSDQTLNFNVNNNPSLEFIRYQVITTGVDADYDVTLRYCYGIES